MSKNSDDATQLSRTHYFAAIQQYLETGQSRVTHPTTDELLQVEILSDIGLTVVSTEKLGVLLRIRSTPQAGAEGSGD